MSRAASAVRAARDDGRESLRSAHLALLEAQTELDAARRAKDEATSRYYEACGKVETMRLDSDVSEDDVEQFIDGFRTGTETNITTLARPADALQRAEGDAVVWEKTKARCETAFGARERAISLAEMGVATAAAGMVRDAGVVTQLLDGFAELHTEYFRRRLLLHFFALKGLLRDEEKSVAMAALNIWIPGRPNDLCSPVWYRDRDYMAWSAALEALKQDADAELPVLETRRLV
jgi:hypothetical protein